MNFRNVPSPFRPAPSTRGMTLVELMIVVAIVGVLAAIGIVSFSQYMQEAKLTELRQYAMDIERGQEQYFSRHHEYYQAEEDWTYTSDSYDEPEWAQLLEFSERVPEQVEIQVQAGQGDCDLGAADPDDDEPCYAILAQNEDLDYDIFVGTGVDGPLEIASDAQDDD